MPESGTVLAFDYGEKRLGVAVGERALHSAHPLAVIDTPATAERFAAISRLIAEWQPGLLVVGLPATTDGAPHPLAPLCRRFANRLHGRFRLPVAFADETLSSLEAEARLQASGRKDRKERQARLDAFAAQVILQTYFASLTDPNHVPSHVC